MSNVREGVWEGGIWEFYAIYHSSKLVSLFEWENGSSTTNQKILWNKINRSMDTTNKVNNECRYNAKINRYPLLL